MQICLIITEYNPFHAGHAYQIGQIRRALPDCAVVSVMSGNYVQRGEPALWDKHLRAQCAMEAGGPDLVLELPVQTALSSAEGFARGGVQLAAALGCVTHLSFGCESGTAARLMQLASCLNSEAFSAVLSDRLRAGVSYAQAASQAAQQLYPDAASLLDAPNDALAVQYCRALLQYAPHIQPLAIRRHGAAHDGAPQDGIPSASYIRDLFASGQTAQALSCLPGNQVRCEAARRHSWADMEPAVLPYLRRLTPEDIRALPGVSEGLEHRFYAACQTAPSLSALWERTRSRRHPLSRVRRLTMCAYLGLTRELSALPPAYASVLAMDARGAQVLRQMKHSCTLPVITKPAQARQLSGDARRLWDFTLRADDLYHVPEAAGSDWARTPYVQR